MTSKTGYMAFLSEPVIFGLAPHPAWAPNPPSRPGAEGFFEAYSAFETEQEAAREAREDFEARRDACDQGNLEDTGDPDQILPVRIHADGRIDIFAPGSDFTDPPLASHDAQDIYRAYGLTPPATPDTPSGGVSIACWRSLRFA